MTTQEEQRNHLFLRLKEICTGEIMPSQLKDLARLFIRLTITCLRTLECRGQHVRETNREIEFEQLASDCIAELFQRDAEGGYRHLRAYFSPLFDSGADPEEIYFATLRLLAHRSQQQLTRIYRQRDPEGARLWRQLAAAIKEHPHLTLKRYIDGYYILWQGGDSGPVREPDGRLLSALLAELLQNHDPMCRVLPALFERLSQFYQSPVAVPFSAVLQYVRSYRRCDQENLIAPASETNLDWPFYTRLIEEALSGIRNMLLNNYIRKGKLTPAEAAALFEALAAKCHAALEGEEETPDRMFLQKNWPAGITMQNQKQIYSIFDYLLRILRRDLQQKIRKFF